MVTMAFRGTLGGHAWRVAGYLCDPLARAAREGERLVVLGDLAARVILVHLQVESSGYLLGTVEPEPAPSFTHRASTGAHALLERDATEWMRQVLDEQIRILDVS
ncbi:hypothetical protein [Streptomyces malaysiensis]|uniref:hypothetical protein n=1 Tax=Streptomyces malaysiensis TaxID=92644 RepID=UPI0011CD48C8|nr:hypothetical protein [Streptomyces malaysiensis]